MKDRFAVCMFVLIVLLLAPSQSTLGSQLLHLPMTEDGEMPVLPDDYQPAYLRVAPDHSGGELRAQLRLGDRVLNFPACISRLFQLPDGQEMFLWLAWYEIPHGRPSTLFIQLPQKRGRFAMFEGWSIAIDMWRVKVAAINRYTLENGRYQQGKHIVDPLSICSPGEIKWLMSDRVSGFGAAPSN